MAGRMRELLMPRALFAATLLLSLSSLLPIAVPVMYLDGHPVYITGLRDAGPVHVYIGAFDRYRLAYLPMLIASVGLLALSVAGLALPGLVSLDYVFLLLVSYTFATIPVVAALSYPVESPMVEPAAGMLVILEFKKVEHTFAYHMTKALFIAGLSLSVAIGLRLSLQPKRGQA